MRSEEVEFQGVVFRRYPESERWADSVYFTPGKADRMRGVGRLHEEIWKAEHGPIPDGHHIHHVDFDPLNNDPANLACLTEDDHRKAHSERTAERGRANPPSAEARARAAEWHRSDEGREWHREHGRRSWDDRQPKAAVCECCGADYETLKLDESTRFCSNACKSKWRRQEGLDDIDHVCECCGATFIANRYARRRYCSRSCSVRHAARRSCSCHAA